MLRAQRETHANQPMLSLRINKNTSDEVWEQALDTIANGMGVPALFNDEVVICSKERAGINCEDAGDYSIVGCVEQTVGGREYSHTEGLRINVAKVLELMMFGGTCPVTKKKYILSKTYRLEQFACFEEFYGQYKRELGHLIKNACRLLNQADISYGENWPAPFLSLFMDGCIETGRDVTRGGTKYNNLSINIAGMANVVNALYAVKEIIYEKRLIPFTEVPKILESDFVGYEYVKEEIDKLPKYGNNYEEVDQFMWELTEIVIQEINRYRTHRAGRFQPGFYTVILHAEMGKYMLATFDGRRRGTALVNSLSPVQGTDTRGPQAVFHSMSRIPMSKMSNGMVLDMKFSPEFFMGEKKSKMKAAVLSYFSMGGMEIQFNVVDRETLLRAQEKPEMYRDLLVRVSGFSTYFVELDKILQDEIIARYMNTGW